MASPRAIAGVLAYLHELYPTREIGAATTEAWSMTFRDWDDERLMASARVVAAQPGRVFFPTPGELAGVEAVEAVIDSGKILRTLEKMSAYSPQVGMIAPNVQQVRDVHGDAVADAYAAAGGGIRCFSDDDTARSIAAREFHKALERYTAPTPPERHLLGSGEQVQSFKRGLRGPESITAIVQRALPKGTAA